ncbi:MAG: indole-3-glycerol phosphate synthase TrpC [Actinobacteria bacterium]|nr:indole-3-glycerol phosphate synthase TrpC [Actinomycetota bacterium]
MYLDKILAKHRQIASRDDRPLSDLVVLAEQSGSQRGFAHRLREDSKSSLAVIAEVKRRSPSRGLLSQDLQPDAIATQYQRAGASCISVLTDSEFFGGSPEDLQKVRNAADLPVLRKDFTVSLRDICDAKIMNADCVLLIASALSPIELKQFHNFAKDFELDVLVEVHDEVELEVAIDVGASMIGVNQRDLKTFQVDQQRAVNMAPKIPSSVLRVAESGVKSRQDAQQLRDAGYHAILVGETLVTSTDISKTLGDLRV